MESFKIGDWVYAKEEKFIHGKIVKIKKDLAYVEFKTFGGDKYLPYKLSELRHEKWCITTNLFDNETYYLAWQKPICNKSGYCWTSREILEDMIKNNTPEHPFLFDSRKAAIKHLKSINISQKCKVIRW